MLLQGISGEDTRMGELQNQLQLMDEQLRTLAKENQRLSQGIPQTKTTGRDETEKMMKEITLQNAGLRRKLDDALQKIAVLEKK